MEKTATTRNYSLDLMRILAICAVVMTHCSASFLGNFPVFSREMIWGNIFDSLSRLGVPCFVMISGALFLDERKEITLKGIFSRQIKDIFIITVVWAIIYSLVFNGLSALLNHRALNLRKTISNMISGHYHMWYLYMIIGLYAATPFLKKFVCKENHNMVLVFIIISLLTQFTLPLVNMVCRLGLDVDIVSRFLRQFDTRFFNGNITYFLMGWYIVHVGIKQKWLTNIIYVCGFLSLVTMIVYVHFTGDYDPAYSNTGMLVFFYSVSVFLAVSNFKPAMKENAAHMLTGLSRLTFGAYIVHVLILQGFRKIFPYTTQPVGYILLSYVVVLLGSFIASFILSKLPYLKKLVKA